MNKYNPEIHHRRSIRLKDYDYSSTGAYFITICTQSRECLLGHIIGEKLVLNDIGQIIADKWQWLEHQHDHIKLDEWVIMPNHLHGIIIITDCRGSSRTAPTKKRKPLGQLIGAFKTVSTKCINEIQNTPGAKLWQRNFYEHIIRNDEEMSKIKEYILNNPANWLKDKNNIDNINKNVEV